MPKVPRPTNFVYLDQEEPRTQRIIQAALTVNVPWHVEDAPVYLPSKVAEIAERIDQRAKQGLTVHPKPDTARTVAHTMRLYDAGHPSLRDSHPHHVEDWSQDPHEVLAYCTNATLRSAHGTRTRRSIQPGI
jgi:hypothetical protein